MPSIHLPPRARESALRIVVTGLIAQHHRLAGVTWDYVQYAAGLARLGHDVYYLEDSGEWPYNVDGGPTGNDYVARDCTPNIEHLARTLERFGLKDRWAYRFPLESKWYGLSDQKREEVLASADLLINVSGTLEHPENYRQVKRLVYIDSDPVFTQVKIAQGLGDFPQRVQAHDVHFSFGEHLSAAVPVTGQRWRPTRQPVLLSEWEYSGGHRDVFTTVMSWTSYQPLVYNGQSFGQKDVELRQFLQLPGRVAPAVLEVALSSTHHLDWEVVEEAAAEVPHDGAPLTPRSLLAMKGWHVVDPDVVCASLDDYRHYVQSSKAEWSVAKNGYVAGQPGWFSCRSACYLAAGRPVVVQDTGFSSVLPVGEGILPFRTMEEAIAAIQQVESDYTRHARAARAIAEEYFDSDKVLSRLVNEAMGCDE